MFLSFLKDNQKECFMELAYKAMMADGEIQESEKGIIYGYRVELEMLDYEIKNMEMVDILLALSGASSKVHKTIIIELLGVLLADKEFSRDEVNFIEGLCNEWNIRKRDYVKMCRFVEDFNEILEEGYEIIVR